VLYKTTSYRKQWSINCLFLTRILSISVDNRRLQITVQLLHPQPPRMQTQGAGDWGVEQISDAGTEAESSRQVSASFNNVPVTMWTDITVLLKIFYHRCSSQLSICAKRNRTLGDRTDWFMHSCNAVDMLWAQKFGRIVSNSTFAKPAIIYGRSCLIEYDSFCIYLF
jgi:hypothetical protein